MGHLTMLAKMLSFTAKFKSLSLEQCDTCCSRSSHMMWKSTIISVHVSYYQAGIWPCGVITLLAELFVSESMSQVYGALHNFLHTNLKETGDVGRIDLYMGWERLVVNMYMWMTFTHKQTLSYMMMAAIYGNMHYTQQERVPQKLPKG